MDVQAEFATPGVVETPLAGDGRSLSLRLGSLDEVEASFPGDAERLAELRFDDGRLAVSIDFAADDGYLIHAHEFGHGLLNPDGLEGVIAPLDEPAWVWQRYLTGQVMPLAAVLQGLEIFHAAVLGLDGRAIAVVADSGTGKTTTALQLLREGLEFVSDDVLVLEPYGDGVRVHPGIGLANLRPGAEALLAELERMGLAETVGRNERAARIALPCRREPLPLSCLFVLTRYEDARELEIEPLDPVDPRLLLASTFQLFMRAPERLARQLDVCARVEQSASVFGVSCGSEVTPEQLAGAIVRRASDARC
jgi:hypothetical protein